MDLAQHTLRTERLLLRPIEPMDASALLRLYGDPEVTREYEIETLTRLEQAEALLSAYLQFHKRFALVASGGSEVIGTCGYTLWDQSSRMASFGYDLARPYWGHGLMREAAAAVLGYGFAVMKLNRVNALTTLYNVRSMKVLTALGFREEGVLPQFAYWKEAFHDMRLFSLLRSSVVSPGA
jgi:ribosomal-protein-alanine N-acetyltransferase